MEEKIIQKRYNSVWPVYYCINACSLFFGKSNSCGFLSFFFLNKKLNKGFTLIELIVAVGIISILATFVLAALNPIAQFQKAQDAKRKSDLAQIARALESYYQDNGKYPASNSYKINITLNNILTALDWGSNQFSPYMDTLPKDPSNSRVYVYYSPLGNQTYYLYTSLERGTKDPQVCNGGVCSSLSTNGILPETCGGTSSICNYGISSPNTSP